MGPGAGAAAAPGAGFARRAGFAPVNSRFTPDAGFVRGAPFAWAPDVRLASGAESGFLRPEEPDDGTVPADLRRRREAPADEVDGAAAAGTAGAVAGAAGSFGRGFPRIARLARELGGFASAVGSTGLVILSVIRAMSTRGRRR